MITNELILRAVEGLRLPWATEPDGDGVVVFRRCDGLDFRVHLDIEEEGRFLQVTTVGLPAVKPASPAFRRMLLGMNDLNERIRSFKFSLDPIAGVPVVTFEAWYREHSPTEEDVASCLLGIHSLAREILALHRAVHTVLEPRFYEH